MRNGIKDIEISGGIYEKNLKKKILEFKNRLNLNIHNYIPFFKKPFVFNLSSTNKIVSSNSIKMAKKSISLASKLNAKYYACHAGFLFDPKINMLGDKPVPFKILDRKIAMKNFIKNIKIINSYAKKKNVKLLVENNVVSKNQYKKYNYVPLMANIKETEFVMKTIGKDVGILLDFGHLNVSAKSLNFSKIEYLKKLNKYIKAYHLSHNNGLADQNKSFNSKSWFWKYIKKDASFCTIEVYSNNLKNLKKLIDITNMKLN
jgi:sugar phosphate isomerase/epimerase